MAIAASFVAILGSDQAPRLGAVQQLRGLPSPVQVTAADIRATPQASPDRAVMIWFRAVQQENLPAVIAATSTAEVGRVGTPRLTEAVRTVAAALGRPTVIGATGWGRIRTVHVVVLAYTRTSPVPATREQTTFRVRRSTTGAWRVARLDYLLDAARRLRRGG